MGHTSRRQFLEEMLNKGKILVLTPLLRSLDATPQETVLLRFSSIKDYQPENNPKVEIPQGTLYDLPRKGFEQYGKDALSDNIQNRERFRRLIGNNCADLGYSLRDLRELNIGEATQLACQLTVNRLDYKGTEAIKRTTEMENSSQNMLTTVNKDIEELTARLSSSTDETEIKKIKEEIEVLQKVKDLETEFQEINKNMLEYHKAVSSGGLVGMLSIKEDETPLDVTYRRKNEVICRHYARITAAIYNFCLRDFCRQWNTCVTNYSTSAIPHAWNQVTTINRTPRGHRLDITFLDPTWLESGLKYLDAFDETHNGPGLGLLKSDVKRFIGSSKTKVIVEGLNL